MMIKRLIILLPALLLTVATTLAVSLPKNGYSEGGMFEQPVYFAGQYKQLLGEELEELEDEESGDWDPNTGEVPGGEDKEPDEDGEWDDDTQDPITDPTPIQDSFIPFTLLLMGYGVRKFYLYRRKK